MLQKLVAIGGAVEQESFEVQVKARLASADTRAARAGRRGDHRDPRRATITSTTPTCSSTIRRRDDCAIARTSFSTKADAVTGARARLTLTGPTREAASARCCCSARASTLPPTHSPRFYREYFKPAREREVEKDRRRWLVAIAASQFYVHLDRLLDPRARRAISSR